MQNIPTPTTSTRTLESGVYNKTTWTIGDHALSHVTKEGSDHERWMTERLDNDAPRVDEDSNWGDDDAPITYSVNWSAWGDRDPNTARAYAARLMTAAAAAETFAAIRNNHGK